jgi:glucose/arabinose dehydrogenase
VQRTMGWVSLLESAGSSFRRWARVFLPARARWLPLVLWLSLPAVVQLRPARAATLPPGFTESLLAGGLVSPTAMDFSPDGRLFVCQQGGSLRVIKNGALLPTPFVTVTTDSSGERGLLGVAFDPSFAVNHYVYVYYTATTPALHNRVSRFTANGDVAAPGSERVILDLNNLSTATNHNGGAIHFGPDGYLYVATGENANPANAQSLNNLLGKILRIGPDGSIPPDNPFVNTATGVNRAIWAYGLRNPFTFAFQRGGSRMFLNDVGQNTWEEINRGQAGANYGWPATEGATTDARFVSPLFAYGHGSGPTAGCAIAGGAFYDVPGGSFPAVYQGRYFFADLCGGWIRVLNPVDNSVSGFAAGIFAPVDLKVGADGSLFYLAQGSGAVFRIQGNGAASPWQAVGGAVGEEATPGARLLWRHTDEEVALWKVDAAGGVSTQDRYGPHFGWSGIATAAGSDGRTRILWSHTSGRISLWRIDAAGHALDAVDYGPYGGWSGKAIATGSDDQTRILWSHVNGTISLWRVDAGGGYLSSYEYGPYFGWSGKAIAAGSDGGTRVLWSHGSGTISLWTVDAGGRVLSSVEYGPHAGWSGKAIAAGSDGQTRILWNHTDGRVSLWRVDALGRYISSYEYGPYLNWSGMAVGAGGDGQTRLLWNNGDGRISLWTVDAAGRVLGAVEYGPPE